jgi:hypothetical protein
MSSEALGLSPHNTAETSAAHAAVTPEKTYRQKGAENRAAFNNKITEKKAWFSGLLDKFKSHAADKAESVVDHAFAVPHMVNDAHEAASQKIDQYETKFVEGAEALGRGAQWEAAYAQYKTVEGAKAIDKGLVDLKEKAHEKMYNFSVAASDKMEQASIATQQGIDAAKAGLTNVKNEIVDTGKSLALLGIGATMKAAEKSKSAWGKFKNFVTLKRLESVQNKEDELKAKLVANIQKKMALMEELKMAA